MNCPTACQALSWSARSLSNRACLGYDEKATASKGNVHDLAPRQLVKIYQEIPQETTGMLYYSIARCVTACIQVRGGSTPY
ncbi:hypothetical protein TNCV_2843271 [Trichonephila clavipes]|nr:hypothetical protein TNCV_2843271 [Trichonephila clavipes]